MHADFDLSRLDDIPDVVEEPAAQEAAAQEAAARPVGAAPAGGQSASAPTRGEVSRRQRLALVVTVVWLAFQVGVLGLRGDFARLGAWYAAAQIGLPVVLSVAALGVALSPGRDGLGPGVGLVRTVAVAAPLGFLVACFACPMPFHYTPPAGGMSFGQWVLVCSDIVLIMGGVPLVLAALVLRRSFASAAGWRSAAVGAACGLGAAAAMHLHCENVLPAHMLLSHGIPALVLAIAGGLVLRYTTRA